MPHPIAQTLTHWLAKFASPRVDAALNQDRVDLLTLEERVLYSAAPVPVDFAEPLEIADSTVDPFDLEIAAFDASIKWLAVDPFHTHSTYSFHDAYDQSLDGDLLNLIHSDVIEVDDPHRELALVDASVNAYEEIVAELQASRPGIEVIVLDQEDVLGQMTATLAARNNLNAVHLIAHGTDGSISLGQQSLDIDGLQKHAQELSTWRSAFADGADFLIYGCEVAATETGESFLLEFSSLLDVDVAASDDLTGHHTLQGDWDFEFSVGTIETSLAFSSSFVENWNYLLPTTGPATAGGADADSGGTLTTDFDVGADYLGNVALVQSSSSLPLANGQDIYLTRYDTTGTATIQNQRINDFLNGNQREVDIAINDYGEMAVVWTSDHTGTDNVYLKLFHADGSVEKSEFRVNDFGELATNASVAIDQTGAVVVAWQGSGSHDANGIFAQQFDRDGDFLGDVIAINSQELTIEQRAPSVAMNSQGDWLVGWHSFESTDIENNSYFSLYQANGDLVFDNAIVFSQTGAVNTGLSVAIDDARNFAISSNAQPLDSIEADPAQSDAVAKSSQFLGFEYVTDWDLTAEVYGQTTPFMTAGNTDQYGMDIALLGGDIRSVWEGQATDGSDDNGVYTSQVQMDGTVVQVEAPLGANAADFQTAVKIAAFHDDQYVVAWAEDNGVSPVIKVQSSGTFVNTAPSASDFSVTLTENRSIVLLESQFGYTDAETTLDKVRIDSLPSDVQLFVNGRRLAAGDTIDREDIAAGHLVATAAHDFDGTQVISFTVNDGFTFANTSNTITVEVTPSADEPTVSIGDHLFAVDGGILVNDNSTVGNQLDAEIAGLANGGYVIVWENEATGEIHQSVFDDQASLVRESVITDSVALNSNDPSVTALADGGYVVSWSQLVGIHRQIFISKFDATGNEVSFRGIVGPQSLYAVEGANQVLSSVAGLDHGGFVLTWTSGSRPGGNSLDILAQVYDQNGGSEDLILVNDLTTGVQRDSRVTALDGNRFAITWTDHSVNNHDVKIKFYDANKLEFSSEITLATDTSGNEGEASLTQLDNGNVVVVWSATGSLDGSGRAVFAKIFDPVGNAVTPNALIVNESTNDHQFSPSVVAVNGGFRVFFETRDPTADGSGSAILSRLFELDGNPVTNDQHVGTQRYEDQETPLATQLANGDILLVFQAQDGDYYGIDGVDDFGSGLYRQILRPAVVVDEDATTPIRFSADGYDTGHAYSQIEVTGFPSGVYLSDGVNQSSGQTSIDISSWDLGNLVLVTPPGSAADFDLSVTTTISDGADSQTRTHQLRVVVNNVNSAISKPDFGIAVDEDSTAGIGLGDLLGSTTDSDIHPLSESPSSTFDASTLPPTLNGGTLEWQNTSGSLTALFDQSGVSYQFDPNESNVLMRRHLLLDGSAGGTLTGVSSLVTEGGIELWVKPDSLTGDFVIWEMGDAEQGLAIIQKNNQIEVHFNATGSGIENHILVADGLSTSKFTQIMVSFGNTANPDSASNRRDVLLYVDGQLEDQLTDASRIDETTSFLNEPTIGLGLISGASIVNGQRFEGAIGNISIYDAAVSSQDVDQRYLNRINLAIPVAADGSSFSTGSAITLPSGALVNVTGNSELSYDPNGIFDSLAEGEQGVDTIEYRILNSEGDFDQVSINVTINGVNSAPVIATIPEMTTSEDTNLSGSLAGFVSDTDTNDTHTFTLISASSGGSFNLNNDGSFDYTPATNFFGTESISFSVADNHGGSTSATFDIVVTSINDLPTSADGSLTIDETTTRTLTASDFSFSDVETPDLQGVRVIAAPASGSLEVDGIEVSAGALISRADFDRNAVTYTDNRADDSLTFRVFDGTAESASTYQLALQSNDLPEAPTSSDFSITTAEDFPFIFSSSLFNFSDNDGDSLAHIEIRSLPANGQLLLNHATIANGTTVTRSQLDNGELSFLPGLNENGVGYTSFQFAVNDGGLDSVSNYTVSIDVDPVNDLPTSADNTIDVNERTTYVFGVNDFTFNDVESTTYSTIEISTAPTIGQLRLNGLLLNDGDVVTRLQIELGLMSYEDSSVNDSFQFRISDGTSFSAIQYTTTMNSIDLPDAPTASDFARTIDEDTSYQIQVSDFNFNDLDGDLLDSVTLISQPSQGALFLNGGLVNAGDSVNRTDIENGNLVFTPGQNQFGTDYSRIEFQVSDGVLLSNTIEARFDVNPVNDAPLAANNSIDVVERTARTMQVADFGYSDVEGEALDNVLIVTAPSSGRLMLNGVQVASGQRIDLIEIQTGNLLYVDAEINDQFDFQVNDGITDSINTYTIELNSIDLPDAPTASDFARTIDEDTSYQIQVSDFNFNDLDGDLLDSVTLISQPSQGALFLNGSLVNAGDSVNRTDIENGNLVFTPGQNQFGTDYSRIEFQVSDGVLLSNTIEARFDVNPVNDAPLAANNSIDVVERTARTMQVADFGYSDVEGEALDNVLIVTAPSSGRLMLNGVQVASGQRIDLIEIQTGNLLYVDAEINDQFDFQVNDGITDSINTYTIELNSIDLPEDPEAIDDAATLDEGARIAIDVLANDIANASGNFEVVSVGEAQHGSTHINAMGEVVYRHDGTDGHSQDQFTYRIVNADGRFDEATVRLTILPVNDVTIVNPDTFLTLTNNELVIDRAVILSNDVDPDSDLAAMDMSLQAPIHGSLIRRNGQIIYIPEDGFSGTDQFNYRLNDAGSLSNTTSITVTVSPGVVATPPNTNTNSNDSRDSDDTDTSTPEDGSSTNGELDESTGTESSAVTTGTSGIDDESEEEASPNIVAVNTVVDAARAQSLSEFADGEDDDEFNRSIIEAELLQSRSNYQGRTDALSLVNLYSANASIESIGKLSDFQATADFEIFFAEMDKASTSYMMDKSNLGFSEVAVSAASLVTAGYLTWMIRGGVMLTTLMSQSPAYQYFDIGSILESARGTESIESIVDQ